MTPPPANNSNNHSHLSHPNWFSTTIHPSLVGGFRPTYFWILLVEPLLDCWIPMIYCTQFLSLQRDAADQVIVIREELNRPCMSIRGVIPSIHLGEMSANIGKQAWSAKTQLDDSLLLATEHAPTRAEHFSYPTGMIPTCGELRLELALCRCCAWKLRNHQHQEISVSHRQLEKFAALYQVIPPILRSLGH